MANEFTAAQLYYETTKLAYTESQMSISPRIPFQVHDAAKLMSQSGLVADAAKDFRQKSPAPMSQQNVDSAAMAVRGALAMLNYVNTHTFNIFTSVQIFDAVENAITAVEAT